MGRKKLPTRSHSLERASLHSRSTRGRRYRLSYKRKGGDRRNRIKQIDSKKRGEEKGPVQAIVASWKGKKFLQKHLTGRDWKLRKRSVEKKS